jgi:uncharacterized cupredoxin-like copper-binding protein
MKASMHRLFGLAALLAIAAIFAAGCGGGSDDGTTTTEAENETAAAAEGSPGGATLAIEMGDFFFAPKNATAQAGSTKIEAPNKGSVEHELVLFKTNIDPADLPTEANGEVDEEKLDEVAEEAGEIADVEAGQTGAEEFDLKPGKYVMFCNLPGHYAQGMYGTVTVE